MKNKNSLIVFTVITIVISLLVSINIYADSKYYVTATVGLNVRKGPGTNYAKTGDMLSFNDEITYIESKNNEQGCSGKWYHIKYSNNTKEGYVCSSYIKTVELATIDKNGEFEKYLASQGFPESYWQSLKTLHNAHSNWVFKAVKTNINFNTAIDNESDIGKSLIDGSDASLRSKVSPAYNSETGVYTQYEPGWYAASYDTVRYYMDPRNFLKEQSIFMFETLDYNSEYQTINSVKKILDESYMKTLYPNYADAFIEAAKKYNVSPTHLASRVRQETGLNGSISSSGGSFVYEYDSNTNQGNNRTYSGIYNFYNIGAYNYKSPAIRGLIWANGGVDAGVTSYNRPWNTPYKAIVGGAQYIAEGFISKGQNTIYFERFNVKPGASNPVYTHQYMTNIRAHLSEAGTIYDSYKNMGLLNEQFIFEIPVYNNMDEKSNSTNTNNNNNTNNNKTESNSNVSVNTIVNNIGVNVSGSNITGIKLGTTGSDLENRVKSVSSNASVSTSNKNTLATGNTITIKSNNETKTYTVLIYGDANGDGKIDIFDLVRTQKIILGTINANSITKSAADANKDGKVDIFDMVRIQKSILNTGTIEQ